MIATDRQQMAQLLGERMTRTYTSLSERQELEPDTSLVKTYLLEANVPESTNLDEPLSVAQRTFDERAFGSAVETRLYPAEEMGLVTVEARVKDERAFIYVDFSNPRYWMMHSMASSNALDWLIEKVVTASPALDRAWLPADLLESISGMGSFRGLSLDYDRRLIPDVDFQTPGAPVEFLKMQLWGNKAADVLRILREKEAFPHETTLSKVKVKFWLSGDLDGDFSLDDVKYDGKVTARGTSFQSHVALVSHFYQAYATQIANLEENYALRPREDEGRLSIEGAPINFVLDREIRDLAVFTESVFSCSPPFRLWGVPIQLADDFYRVEAVDLHVGKPLQFEVAPRFIRVYLPAGTCGNTVVRLYTNLQHHYDSLIRAEDGDGRPVFEF